MFKQVDTQDLETVEVVVDGEPRKLQAGISVMAALLADGELNSRLSPTSGKPCGPHCLMGVCFECLMEIDGIQRQACTTEIEKEMVINRHLSETGENSHE